MICPYCDQELQEGDGEETPPLYCDGCGIGWDMTEDIADWLYRKLFSDGRAYHGPGWYALADMLKRHKREGPGDQAIKITTKGGRMTDGKKIMRKLINRSKKRIIKKITRKPCRTKIRIRRET